MILGGMMGFLKKIFKEAKRAVKNIGKPFEKGGRKLWEATKDASDTGYNLIGQQSPDEKRESKNAVNAAEAAARKAAHDADVAELSKSSLGAINLRRRRGSAATMLTGTMGSNMGSSGKTLLSQ